MPPEMPISRFFMRLTTRVGLPQSGQGISCATSAARARSAVFACPAILFCSSLVPLDSPPAWSALERTHGPGDECHISKMNRGFSRGRQRPLFAAGTLEVNYLDGRNLRRTRPLLNPRGNQKLPRAPFLAQIIIAQNKAFRQPQMLLKRFLRRAAIQKSKRVWLSFSAPETLGGQR